MDYQDKNKDPHTHTICSINADMPVLRRQIYRSVRLRLSRSE